MDRIERYAEMHDRRSRRSVLFGAVELTAGGAIALAAGRVGSRRTVLAQDATPGATPEGDLGVASAFSDTITRTLGFPEMQIEVGPDGLSAPSSLEAGYYLVTLSAADGYVAYLDVMQPPAGLGEKEATDLALAAGRNDLAQPDWVYLGGANTFDLGVPVSFVIHFEPGEYQIAASYYKPEQGSEEIMRLSPLTVTAGAGTPPAQPEPPAGVTLEATDELRFIVSPNPVPAGPQFWKIANTGSQHSHHVVMFGIPEGITADDIVADISSDMSGTPSAGEPLFATFVGVGYAALQSGGQTTWSEFDLKPGSYAVICFIVDPMTKQPHVLDGMAAVFTVQ